MCDIQYKGQLSKEQVRERVGKYPLENPATHKDLQHLADALDRNGTCPLARAINALTDKASDGKLYKPGRNDLMRLYDELALHKHLRLKVDDTTKLIYFICPPQGREQPLTVAKHVHSDNTHLDRFCTAMRTHPRTNSLPHAENTSTTILVAYADEDLELVDDFMTRLTVNLAIFKDYDIQWRRLSDIVTAFALDAQVVDKHAAADYIMELITPNYLSSPLRRIHDIASFRGEPLIETLPILLEDTPLDELAEHLKADLSVMYCGNLSNPSSYADQTTTRQRNHFIDGFIDRFKRTITQQGEEQ
ncbi:hypothetical protein [Actinomyces bouchesdurhonensis]|uniref:hypothetical protein n=1 Tax=Actinomyces bouchesdurhonensis TaxID=1852361 RepID=UPI0028E2421D|nr:hypothetical protein [Actinomyces bouchesdurhonensis]